jgi:GPH family glycoside/pentoside/hexuronide:cation symporter
MAALPRPAASAFGWRHGVAYGALGLPLAFVALPLYVVLPDHYAREFGVPLGTLGAVLLATRALDAFVDPWIGRLADRLFAGGAMRAWTVMAAAAALLALGFRSLFFPMVTGASALVAWCAAALTVTCLAYSIVGVLHQSWGARLGGDASRRTRIVAWREGLALVGVIASSMLSSAAGLGVTALVFALTLLGAVMLLSKAERPTDSPRGTDAAAPLMLPFSTPAFRRLIAIYLANGIASAVPATLVLFFIRDRLQAPDREPLFLAGYFAAAALSVPLWTRSVARWGIERCWLAGMLLAISVFAWAALLGAGDVHGYLAVCVLSGIALGADLTLPGALLTGVIQAARHDARSEGAYFGWWNFATKLNLALAAGLALPTLQALGYAPGSRDAQALSALTVAYCLLPCVLKLVAAVGLYAAFIRRP